MATFLIGSEAFSLSAAEETFSKGGQVWDVQVAAVAVLRAWARNGQRCYVRHFPLSPSFLPLLVLP